MAHRRKRLSQIFLRHTRYIQKIAGVLEVDGENVLEIGPGEGALTREIFPRARQLWSVEIDQVLIGILGEKFGEVPNLSLIRGDILSLDLNTFPQDFIVFSNVPYHISSELIEYLLRYHRRIRRAYLLLQKEFVAKLIARPPKREYSFLACAAEYYSDIKVLFSVPRKAFSPPPAVDSVFIRMDFSKKPRCSPAQEEKFLQLLKQSFKYPRKTLFNSLRMVYPGDRVISMFEKAGISLTLRPHQVSLEGYCRLNRLF